MFVSDSKRFIKKLERGLNQARGALVQGSRGAEGAGEAGEAGEECPLGRADVAREASLPSGASSAGIAGEERELFFNNSSLPQLQKLSSHPATEAPSAPLPLCSPAPLPLCPFAPLLDEDDTPEPEEDRQLKVWSVHSENSGSEENVIFIKEINIAIKDINALLATPSLGTGVDISTPHFDAVFGVFHAVSQGATECAQQLWRNRPDVPMHVWVAPRPPFGYAETNARRIKEKILQKNEMTAFLIRIDRETGKRGAEKDWALDASCQIEAQRNWSINNLRSDLRTLLEEMGNTIIPVGDGVNEEASRWMKAIGVALDWEHYTKVANAKDIDKKTYTARLSQDYLKPEEALECEKFRIQDTYGMSVTPELVEKDNGGRLIRKIMALEAILAQPGEKIIDEAGREFVTPPDVVVERDKSERKSLSICTDWSNHSTSWLMRHHLGLHSILTQLMAGAEVRGNESMIQTLAEFSKRNATHVKAILNLTIPADKSPMWILGQYLEQLGLSTVFRRPVENGKRVRYYRLNPSDVAFVQQVLSYRQQQREQREKQKLEEQERNAAYAARMQALYGIEPTEEQGSGGAEGQRQEAQEPGEGSRGKISLPCPQHPAPLLLQPLHPCPSAPLPLCPAASPAQEPLRTASTPPPNISGEIYRGGMDGQNQQVEILNDNWWHRVKNYAQLLVERLEYGVEMVKQLLSTLPIDERWGVIFEFESVNPDKFTQLISDAPNWEEWMC